MDECKNDLSGIKERRKCKLNCMNPIFVAGATGPTGPSGGIPVFGGDIIIVRRPSHWD